MRLLSRLFGKKSEDNAAGPALDDDAPDPDNPFPEIVVVEFSDVLDLHSIPPRLARAVVEDYLEEGRRRGVRFLRIIHGKGIGTQREMVRSILGRTPFVSDFQDAPAEAGGWGATIVTLKAGPCAEQDE
jgi:dsDNA-specific endonuclease/ATPase MutS2